MKKTKKLKKHINKLDEASPITLLTLGFLAGLLLGLLLLVAAYIYL